MVIELIESDRSSEITPYSATTKNLKKNDTNRMRTVRRSHIIGMHLERLQLELLVPMHT